jgi:hypothetical protein
MMTPDTSPEALKALVDRARRGLDSPSYNELLAVVEYFAEERRVTKAAIDAWRGATLPKTVDESLVIQLAVAIARIEELEHEIAEAREACPRVRMQDHFDDPLLQLVQGEISLSIRRECEAKRLAEEVGDLKRKLFDANRVFVPSSKQPIIGDYMTPTELVDAFVAFRRQVEDLANDRAAADAEAAKLRTTAGRLKADLDAANAEVAQLRGEVEQRIKDREAAEAETAKLRAELNVVDNVLARRPALDKPTRWENIEHAISTAARADRLQAENELIRGHCSWVAERLKTVVSNIERTTETTGAPGAPQ